jgi:hypothetical protein
MTRFDLLVFAAAAATVAGAHLVARLLSRRDAHREHAQPRRIAGVVNKLRRLFFPQLPSPTVSLARRDFVTPEMGSI